MKRLFVTLKSPALIRGSLPRPWGEGGPPDGGPGEGRPTGIASQIVQTPEAPVGKVGKGGPTERYCRVPWHCVSPGYQVFTAL